MYKIKSSSEKETINIAMKLAKHLKAGDILALKGQLGAGKTTFIKGLAKGLGIKQEIRSPTFVILNVYKGKIPLYHFDVYRLKDLGDLIQLGYEEYFYADGICVIEWAEKIEDLIEKEHLGIAIKFAKGGKNLRSFAFFPKGGRFKKLKSFLRKGFKQHLSN